MNQFRQAMAAASGYLNERTPQERKLIAFAAVFLVLALTYMLLIEPAVEGRAQLAKNLPALRQQAVELQTMAAEAATLAPADMQPATPATKESLEAALARQGLKAQNLTLTGDFVRVQFAAAPFPAIANWLDEVRRTSRLSVSEASVTALAEPGSVNATLTMRQQRSE